MARKTTACATPASVYSLTTETRGVAMAVSPLRKTIFRFFRFSLNLKRRIDEKLIEGGN
jgi:hypothetical protein